LERVDRETRRCGLGRDRGYRTRKDTSIIDLSFLIESPCRKMGNVWRECCLLRRDPRSEPREIGRHFCGMSCLLFFLRVSWVSLAGCGAGEEEVAFAGVAGKGGGAFELGAGFGVAA
jgi:hypothetical protein